MARFAPLLLLTLSVTACADWSDRYAGELPPPNPPTFCYETIGRAACYDRPQIGLGELINAQLPPVILPPTPVIVTPAAILVPTTAIAPVESDSTPETVYVTNPDPYPEPGDKAQPVFTDAPVPLAPLYPAH